VSNHADTNPAIIRIKKHYSLMSAKERKAADYIMSNPQQVMSLSTAKISQNAGISAATLVRFSKSIGFLGIGDFKNYLRREMLSPNSVLPSFDSHDSIEQIAVKTSDYNKRAIDETLVIMNAESLTAAVDAIERAERVFIFAEGGSGCSARCAYDGFLQIGLRCSFVMDPFFQVMEATKLGARDAALGLCHSGRARNTVDAVQLAKEAGATTVSIVGIVGSPITKHSDILLYTGLADNSFHSETMAVRICELNVISVLQTALALRKKKQLDDYRRVNSELFKMKRYND